MTRFKIPFVLLLSVSLLLKMSCKKAENAEAKETVDLTVQKFFQKSEICETPVKRLALDLKAKYNTKESIEKLTKDFGYPIWEKSVIKINKTNTLARTSTETDTVVLVPFIQPNQNTIKTYLEAHLTSTIVTNFHVDNNYSNHAYGLLSSITPNAEKFAMEFMLLDRRVFGSTKFFIMDTALFKKSLRANNQILPTTDGRLVLNLSANTANSQKLHFNEYPECEQEFEYVLAGNDGEFNTPDDIWTGTTYTVIDLDCVINAMSGGSSGSGGPSSGFGGGFGGLGTGGGSTGGTGGGPTGGGSGGGTPTNTGWQPKSETLVQKKERIKNELNAILQTGDSWIFDDNIDIESSLVFNSVSSFNTYMADEKNRATYEYNTQQPTVQGNIVTDECKVRYSFFWPHYGVKFTVSSTQNANNTFDFSNVSSSEYGLTIGWSWSQTTNSTTPNLTNTATEYIITVSGTQNYNVFLEGLGTIYKAERKYVIKVSRITGKITSISQP